MNETAKPDTNQERAMVAAVPPKTLWAIALATLLVSIFALAGVVFLAGRPTLTDAQRIDMVKQIAEAVKQDVKKEIDTVKAAVPVPPPARDPFGPVSQDLRDLAENGDNLPVFGPKDAPIDVVVFSDFNCPYCRKEFPILLRIIDERKDVRMIFRDIPIISRESVDLATVAHALNGQGLYLKFVEKAETYNGRMNEAAALQIAADLGADMPKLRDNRLNNKTTAAIRGNLDVADKLKITGTPTLLINGRYFRGARSYDDIVKILDQALRYDD